MYNVACDSELADVAVHLESYFEHSVRVIIAPQGYLTYPRIVIHHRSKLTGFIAVTVAVIFHVLYRKISYVFTSLPVV